MGDATSSRRSSCRFSTTWAISCKAIHLSCLDILVLVSNIVISLSMLAFLVVFTFKCDERVGYPNHWHRMLITGTDVAGKRSWLNEALNMVLLLE
jgi:hypothetical protein